MNESLMIWLAALGLLTASIASLGAKNLRHFSHRRLEVFCRARKRRGLFDEIVDLHDEAADSAETLRVLGVVLFVFNAALLAAKYTTVDDWRQPAATIAATIGILLAVAIWIPWAVVRYLSAPFLANTWWFWRWIHRLLWPLTLPAILFDSLFRRLANAPKQSPRQQEERDLENEIISMAAAGRRDGLMEEDLVEMIEGVMELDDMDVKDIMTPRSKIDALDVNASWEQVVEFAHRVGRTRIPVYERGLDNVVGVLYVKDLLPELVQPPERRKPLHELLREPWLIPAIIPLDDLLQDFLETRKHQAIVVNEFGGVIGLVTIEDILEEIVGEIVDESDKDVETDIRQIDQNQFEVLGSVHLDTLNERLGLELPQFEDVDTIAGVVISRLGRIPKIGDQVRYGTVQITVLEATSRQVVRLRIHKVPDDDKQE